jgi:hypothetical protein
MANAFLWSVLGRRICDTLWFRLASDGAIWPAQIPFRCLNQTGFQALLVRCWLAPSKAGIVGKAGIILQIKYVIGES